MLIQSHGVCLHVVRPGDDAPPLADPHLPFPLEIPPLDLPGHSPCGPHAQRLYAFCLECKMVGVNRTRCRRCRDSLYSMPINEHESAYGPDVVGYTWLVHGFQRGDFFMADPGDPELHLEGMVPVLSDALQDIRRSVELRARAG